MNCVTIESKCWVNKKKRFVFSTSGDKKENSTYPFNQLLAAGEKRGTISSEIQIISVSKSLIKRMYGHLVSKSQT